MYTLRIRTKFEAAHRLPSSVHKGCQRLHGHSYKVDWFFQASGLNEDYMVVDFTLIKERTRNITDRFDHVTILNDADAAGTLPSWMRVVTMPNSPTAENMARFFYTEYFRRHEADKCALLKVRVWETEDSYAEYTEAE